MHTCISSLGLKRSWRSCPRRVNAGNKNTPSTHHPRRQNVTTLMVGLKKRSHTQKSHPKVVKPRDIAGERKNKNKTKKYTDTGPTSPSADLITSDRAATGVPIFQVTGMTRPAKRSMVKAGIEPRSSPLEADALTTRPTRCSKKKEKEKKVYSFICWLLNIPATC